MLKFFKDLKIGTVTSGLVFAGILLIIIFKTGRVEHVIKDFTEPLFLVWAIPIIIGSTYLLYFYKSTDKNEEDKIWDATRQAVIALIIAYFAKLKLIFASYFLIWLFTYHITK